MAYLFNQSDLSKQYTQKIGAVVSLMLQNKRYQFYPMACLIHWIHTPIILDQIKLFYNEKGNPVGYLTWAYLAPDVEEKWVNDPKAMLHISEWNEGEELWIMDFMAPTGFAKVMLNHVMEEMFSEFNQAKSLRRNVDGSVRKVSIWRR